VNDRTNGRRQVWSHESIPGQWTRQDFLWGRRIRINRCLRAMMWLLQHTMSNTVLTSEQLSWWRLSWTIEM
jgi:hypothetical protein